MKTYLTRIFAFRIIEAITVFTLAACTPAPGPVLQTVAPGATGPAGGVLPVSGASPSAALRIPTNTPTLPGARPLVTLPAASAAGAPTATPVATATPAPPPFVFDPQATFAPELDRAVAALRHLDVANLDEAQTAAMNAADETLKRAGPQGARRLKQELAALQQSGEQDVAFQLEAAWLLWEIGNLDEVDNVVMIWRSVPTDQWIYRALFMPGMEAAATQDPRALPMLLTLLADRQGSAYISQHDLTLDYPRTHEFLWGAYGSQGLPALFDVLLRSTNPVAIESAIYRLASAQYLPALDEIRLDVDHPDAGVRAAAVYALGEFGHPDDYQTLINGLTAADTPPEDLYTYAFALNEFGDVRAVPYLIPLLQTSDEDLRMEVAYGLGDFLATPEGLAALRQVADQASDPQWKEFYQYAAQQALNDSGLTWTAFQTLSPDEQRQVTEQHRLAEITLKPDEKPLTHDQLLDMVSEWRKTGQLSSEKWGWVQVRHVLPAATADDIDLLLDGKALFYLRLSDEAIADAAVVDNMIQWIGRSRYR